MIEIRNVAKRYRRKAPLVVDHVDLDVAGGEIVGVLGPNGAGKTTLLKVLCGAVKATDGTCRIAGMPASEARASGKVGALLEEPGFHPFLSARDNLRWLAGLRGLGEPAVEEALAAVRLGEAADRPFREYSLGMRKRAGLASAILGDPDACILDEPTNGLDAHGVIDMRALLMDLRAAGKAVLLSTHVSEDVHELCDRVAILHRGKIRLSGSADDLLDAGEVKLTVEPLEQAVQVLSDAFGVTPRVDEDGTLRSPLDKEQVAHAVTLLAKEGVLVRGIEPRTRNLAELLGDLSGAA